MLHGEVHWIDPVRGGNPVVSGAGRLKIINDGLIPGYSSGAPAVPGAGSTATVWRDALVVVSGGSSVNITINGHATGLASGAVFVPSGKTVGLGSYTGSPVWTWWLS